VMFAPVYYEQPIYRRANYYYSPTTVIDLAVMLTSLFVQPRSHHYYYGDYYDRRYEERGFYPWYSRQVSRYGDDPIYAHYRSRQLLQDPDWDTHVDEQYRYRREHIDARPPQTLALQLNIVNNQSTGARENVILGRSLTEAIQSRTLPHRFTPVNMDERKQIETRGREVHKLQSERARIEMPTRETQRSSRDRETAQPVRMRLPASPVAARSSEHVEGARTPPPMPVVPEPQAVEGRGRQEEPQRETARPETSRSRGRSESNAQPDRTETRKQKEPRERASRHENNRNKKSKER